MFETELQQTQLILGIVVIIFGFFVGYTKFVYKKGRDKGFQSAERKAAAEMDNLQLESITKTINDLEESLIHRLDDVNKLLDSQHKTLTDHIEDDKTEFGILHTRLTDSLKDSGDIKKLLGELDGKLKFIIKFYDDKSEKKND